MLSRKTIFTLITIFIISTGIFLYGYFQQRQLFGDIFKNSYYDQHIHHNQYIDSVDWLIQNKFIDTSPKTLIQVDYHSDIYKDNPNIDYSYEGIGNWINVLMTRISSDSAGLINEIYWVIPDQTKNKDQIEQFWNTADVPTQLTLRNGPQDIVAYMDDQSHRIQFTPGDTLRQIPIHKVLLQDLPSFKNSDKQILLSIDYDFFIYNSLDENFVAYPNLTNNKINQDSTTLVNTLHQKDIRPIFTGCSISVGYIQEKWRKNLDKFCKQIESRSKTHSDILDQYTHTITAVPKEIAPSFKKAIPEPL